MRACVHRQPAQRRAAPPQRRHGFRTRLAVQRIAEEEAVGSGGCHRGVADPGEHIARPVPGRAVDRAVPKSVDAGCGRLQVVPGADAVLEVGIPKPRPLVPGRIQEHAVARTILVEIAARADRRRIAFDHGSKLDPCGRRSGVARGHIPATGRQRGPADFDRLVAGGPRRGVGGGIGHGLNPGIGTTTAAGSRRQEQVDVLEACRLHRHPGGTQGHVDDDRFMPLAWAKRQRVGLAAAKHDGFDGEVVAVDADREAAHRQAVGCRQGHVAHPVSARQQGTVLPGHAKGRGFAGVRAARARRDQLANGAGHRDLENVRARRRRCSAAVVHHHPVGRPFARRLAEREFAALDIRVGRRRAAQFVRRGQAISVFVQAQVQVDSRAVVGVAGFHQHVPFTHVGRGVRRQGAQVHATTLATVPGCLAARIHGQRVLDENRPDQRRRRIRGGRHGAQARQ